jgi:hypothetical protein
MATHEDRLLDVLEKVGQPGVNPPPAASAPEAASAGLADEEIGTPVTRKNLFTHYESHPVVFDVALLKHYGTDWIVWEPVTLWREIMSDFHVPSISDHTKTKIQAVRTIHINEWYWTKWEVNCWVTQALNGSIPDFHVMQKPSLGQLMNAVDAATMVRNDEHFSPEVAMWTAASMADEGVFYAPEMLAFCQPELIRALEVTHAQHVKEMVADVEKRYHAIMQLPDSAWTPGHEPVLHENPVDVQVAKLKVAKDYVTMRRRQLKTQLGLLQ